MKRTEIAPNADTWHLLVLAASVSSRSYSVEQQDGFRSGVSAVVFFVFFFFPFGFFFPIRYRITKIKHVNSLNPALDSVEIVLSAFPLLT